jgi:GxxExxY protein
MNTDQKAMEHGNNGKTGNCGESMLHAGLTEIIIKSFYKVYNTLGYGFLEKVYENALAFELEKNGLRVKIQENIKVFYEGREVGDYYADLLVNEIVIVELKAAESLRQEHAAQLINYCKATGIEVGLLLNFGKSPEVKRVLFPRRIS